jgi:hypothetical protein
MNKYQKHSSADVRRNVIDPLDVADEAHKDAMDYRAEQVRAITGCAARLFELLMESGLTADNRLTAIQMLTALHNNLGRK